MGTLFKNGTVVTASAMFQADVLVEGEIIWLIGKDIAPDGHDVVECAGKYLMPGGIDVHTHLDLPFGGTFSNDDFNVGHMAAAFGAYLRARYPTVAALNRAWGSAYASFAAVELPSYAAMRDLAPADLPLIYEYRKFRKRVYAQSADRVYKAFRKGDGNHHPVANRLARMYLNGTNFDPFDALGLATVSTDIFCTASPAARSSTTCSARTTTASAPRATMGSLSCSAPPTTCGWRSPAT